MKRRAVLYADDDIHWPLVLLWLCQITDVLGTVLFITAVWRGWGDPVPVPDTSEGGGTTCSPSVDLNFAPSTAGGKAGVIESLHLVCCLCFWSAFCVKYTKETDKQVLAKEKSGILLGLHYWWFISKTFAISNNWLVSYLTIHWHESLIISNLLIHSLSIPTVTNYNCYKYAIFTSV